MAAPEHAPDPAPLPKKAYGPDSTAEDVEALRAQIYEWRPGVIMYREAPVLTVFQIETFGKKFDEIIKTRDSFKIIIDLTSAGRPSAPVRARLKQTFKKNEDRIEHIGVFTGRNFVLNMAAKFVLGGLGLKGVTVVKTLDEAVRALDL